MGTRRIELCILCLFCSGISAVFSASLEAFFTPNPALKGASSQHTVQCSFNPGPGETIQSVQLISKAGDKLIASLYPNFAKPLWNTEQVAIALKARGDLLGSFGAGFLKMVLNDTTCGDKGVTYLCRMLYTVGSSGPSLESETTVDIEAGPGEPDPMTVAPPLSSQTMNVTEFSAVSFSCSGNVGLPAGNFSWFTTIGGTGNRHSVTQQASQQNPQPSGDGCTFTQTSSLMLNLTRTEEGQPLVVLCLVDQLKLGDPSGRDCSNPSQDFCRRSFPINVLYPVSVSISSGPWKEEEGTDVSIPCTASGNPRPHLIEWRREGENDTLSTEAVLVLRNVSMSDTGSFVCTAYNVISGVTEQASETVHLTVEKRTTPAPTTTPPSTPEGQTTPGGDSSPGKAGLSDTDTIIIVVVLVSVAVIVTIIVIVVIVRRRKAQKSLAEVPEKALNNQPDVSTIAMQSEPSVNNDQPPENGTGTGYKNKDGLMYADLQFDNKPRSRRPLAIDDSHTEYADISMPQV